MKSDKQGVKSSSLRTSVGSAGVTLIELMVSLALIGLAFVAIANSSRAALVHFKRSLRETYATELAVGKMEELAARDPQSIPAGTQTESISENKVEFLRKIEVTVNENKSRSVVVTVSGKDPAFGGSCTLSNTFPLREKS